MINAPGRPEFRNQANRQNDGRRSFDYKSNRKGVTDKANHPLYGIQIIRLLNQQPFLQGNALPHHHKQKGGNGHKTESADLNQD